MNLSKAAQLRDADPLTLALEVTLSLALIILEARDGRIYLQVTDTNVYKARLLRRCGPIMPKQRAESVIFLPVEVSREAQRLQVGLDELGEEETATVNQVLQASELGHFLRKNTVLINRHLVAR